MEGGAFGWDEMVPNLEPTDSLPDHGEAWRLPWEVLGGGRMRCKGRLLPWELDRQVSLGEGVAVNYRYRNAGDRPHLAYWCAHPLFKLEAEMEAGLPIPADGTSRKVFLPSGSTDRHRLTWRSGACVELSWDPVLTPDVAIWLCNGDLGGYRQIAIEPSWTKPFLAPGGTHSWWLQITPL